MPGSENCLPIGTRLHDFEITGVLGEGGFGIVYIAFDHSLQRNVAIKEYMPGVLATRGEDHSIRVRADRHQETFLVGQKSFINEARFLAQFDHPSLVKVYRFWEQNRTAYTAILKLFALVVHGCFVVMVLQARPAVARRIRLAGQPTGAWAAVRSRIADVWHLVAIFYIVALWLVCCSGAWRTPGRPRW